VKVVYRDTAIAAKGKHPQNNRGGNLAQEVGGQGVLSRPEETGVACRPRMPPNYNGESDRKQSSAAHAAAQDAARLKYYDSGKAAKALGKRREPEPPKGPDGNIGSSMGVGTWRWRSAARGFCLKPETRQGLRAYHSAPLCCTCVIVQKAHRLAQESRDGRGRLGKLIAKSAETFALPGAEKAFEATRRDRRQPP
jgi:hypothetical protein